MNLPWAEVRKRLTSRKQKCLGSNQSSWRFFWWFSFCCRTGQVPVSLGSDTGGSIRQPAAFNGIVGLKPTYGRVSRFGLIAFASSLDQIGPLTRNVKDNALALNAISGYDEKDGTSAGVSVPDFTADLTGDIKGMKIALPKEYLGEGYNLMFVKRY